MGVYSIVVFGRMMGLFWSESMSVWRREKDWEEFRVVEGGTQVHRPKLAKHGTL